jgi:glycosidase
MSETKSPIESRVAHPAWSRDACIYQVNLRQYSAEGTIAAFEPHLPRLKSLGADILWLMPVHPIGEKNRKGGLGSPYSIRDHTALNPDVGTLADLRRLVRTAHRHGMHVILDWVANHTAWDHVWLAEHPEWYLKNAQGEIHAYTYDNGHELEYWTDVVGLDYAQPAVCSAMADAMHFWLREADIDGFRCDVAALVPITFWERIRSELEAIKPVFMLAEWSDPLAHAAAFDMTYDWALHDVMKLIARGQADASDLQRYLENAAATYPADAYRMTFTSNHDKNAWEGHDGELFGPAFKAMAVLAATLPGMPLVYGGQESGLHKRLAFFECDPIEWGGRFALGDFYAGLLRLKHDHPALANGAEGAAVQVIPLANRAVFAFRRAKGDDAVTVMVNLSGRLQDVRDAGMAAIAQLDPWAAWIHTQPKR